MQKEECGPPAIACEVLKYLQHSPIRDMRVAQPLGCKAGRPLPMAMAMAMAMANVCGRVGSTDARHARSHPVAERVSRTTDIAGQLISWAHALE